MEIIQKIHKILKTKNTILFVTSNIYRNNSSDLDIYCVIEKGSSCVKCFYDKNKIWNEIFIDTLDDFNKKIKNFDEIAINFILEMDFIYGKKYLYNRIKKRLMEKIKRYQIPEHRSNVIKYRVKVLTSKLFNPTLGDLFEQRKFLLNSLTYYIIQSVLLFHNIFPSSPKNWIFQLKKRLPKSEFKKLSRIITGDCTDDELKIVIKEYIGDLKGLEIDKIGNNNLTYIF